MVIESILKIVTDHSFGNTPAADFMLTEHEADNGVTSCTLCIIKKAVIF
jgi:hypothetical protein